MEKEIQVKKLQEDIEKYLSNIKREDYIIDERDLSSCISQIISFAIKENNPSSAINLDKNTRRRKQEIIWVIGALEEVKLHFYNIYR